MTVNTKKKNKGEKKQEKKEQLRQTAHSGQSSLPKIRLKCKQLVLNHNKELILRLRAACDWLKYQSSILGWRETDFILYDRDTEGQRYERGEREGEYVFL